MKKDPFFAQHDQGSAPQQPTSNNTPPVVPEPIQQQPVVQQTEPSVASQPAVAPVTPQPAAAPVASVDESVAGDAQPDVDQQLEQQLESVAPVMPPVKQVTTPQARTKQKKSGGLSFRAVMIGCIAFLLLIVAGLSFVFYSMLSNPNQERTLIPRQTAQDLLITFAWVFFVVIFFMGVFFLAINITRLLSKKKSKKAGYIIGAVVGFLLMMLAIGLGIPTITAITQAGQNKVDRIVDPYVMLPSGTVSATAIPRPLLIAPTKIFYQLNNDVYRARVLLPLGSPEVTGLTLSCGNDQTVAYNVQSKGFGPCLYTTKKSYPLSLTVQYIDRATSETKTQTVDLASVAMDAAIDIAVVDGEVVLNDQNDELLLGTAPIKLRLDAQDIVTSFGLESSTINRDLDADQVYEQQQTAIVKNQFLRSQLYSIAYQIPGLSDYVYGLDMRVLQPETPVCQVKVIQQSDSVYRFQVEFVEGREKISQYAFAIKDLTSDSIIASEKVRSNTLDYDFVRGGEYAVRATFITQDGKSSSCESDDFSVGEVAYQTSYDVSVRSVIEPRYAPVAESSVVSVDDKGYTITQLPMTFKFSDIQVFPRTANTKLTMLLDGAAVLGTSETEFAVQIAEQGEHRIQFQVEDQDSGQKTIVKTILVTTDVEGVVGKLLVEPDTVGTEPFEVEFDASTTTVNDPDDEVVYFTRDFGDGETKKNINQAIIKHTYYFDENRADGRYYPSLIMTTKKGRELTVKLDSPIIVKRSLRDVSISLDSHPGQVAQAGEFVRFSLAADGIPSRIKWSFAADDTLECAGRECTEASRTFSEPGEYTITVTVSYEDHPDVEDEVVLLVQ